MTTVMLAKILKHALLANLDLHHRMPIADCVPLEKRAQMEVLHVPIAQKESTPRMKEVQSAKIVMLENFKKKKLKKVQNATLVRADGILANKERVRVHLLVIQ
jgi:hypothetical protein